MKKPAIIGLLFLTTALITACNQTPPVDDSSNKSTGLTDQSEISNILGQNDVIQNTDTNSGKADKYSQPPEVMSADKLKNKKSIFKTEKGTIEIELFGDEAPLAATNHIFLVQEKFYDNLTFHRREEGFVIQGGDPLGTGMGGPGYRFEDEPVMRKYERGIVAMANAGPDTNGSQFFIMLGDTPLPPAYTIFGKVISGMDAVDTIVVGDKILEATIKDLN